MNVSPEEAQEWRERNAVDASIQECEKLFATGIFSGDGVDSPFFKSATIHLLIVLNDLLQKADKVGRRVSFVDDVAPADEINDVTTLINSCRNAACHIPSKEKAFQGNTFDFNVFVGKSPNAVGANGAVFGSDYEDDIAVQFGSRRLYLGRHLLRALNEVTAALRDS
ncbi:hypothetical protein PMO31116_04733 [Pandoraea morbifera]|uniref:Uncharacterized protein n=1 Tax=Pandoraea morbifera TaxID=2508300 RepID=A0A5E4YTK7_9BURK|nr:hypothetical protein [Pandoraea morbifera]VVE52234.1 hypothetical protein PMO31116_04733 [Pandoraea morbifera]